MEHLGGGYPAKVVSILLWDSGKESKQPQQLERERKLAKPLVDSGRFIIFSAETPPSAQALALFCYPPYCKVGFFVPFWDYFGTFG